MCPPTAYGLRGFALRLPPPPPFRGGRVALCRQGCRAYGPAALLSFTPAGSVGRSRSVKGRCAFRGWPVSSLRCGPRQPPPPPLTALPLQQPDSQTAANRSKRPVAAFFGLGGTSGRGGARKRAVGPFPGFLAVSADSTLNGHLFQYFVDSSPLHLDTWLLRLPARSSQPLAVREGLFHTEAPAQLDLRPSMMMAMPVRLTTTPSQCTQRHRLRRHGMQHSDATRVTKQTAPGSSLRVPAATPFCPASATGMGDMGRLTPES